MACLFPISVLPNPPVVSPPIRLKGSIKITFLPILEAWIAAETPAEVPP